MPRVRLDLDKETFDALVIRAAAERRPVPLQAEVILRQALQLPFPYPDISGYKYPQSANESHI
jgi:hypothetical protein